MIDPLNVNIPMEGVETELPLLPEGDYPLQVVESSIGANKDNNGLNWNLKLATTSVVTAVDQREVKPNFPLFQSIALQPREDSTDKDAFRRGIGEAIDAIFGTNKSNRPAFTKELCDQALGKNVVGHVVISEWQGRKNNKIKRLKAVAQ